MSKFIQFQFPDGAIFEIPARWVAELRGRYYADKDFRDGETNDIEATYTAEVESALADPAELVDYLANNLDWDDFRTQIRQVQGGIPARYEEMWEAQADLKVVEHD